MRQILKSSKVTERTISIQEINERLPYVEDRKVSIVDGGPSSEHTIYDIVLTANAEGTYGFEYIDSNIPVSWMYEGKGRVVAIPNERYDEVMRGELHISDITSRWEHMNAYDPDKYKYCIWNGGGWDLADLDGNAIPYPVFFGYIGGDVNNARYDLDKVLEFMKSDPRFKPALFNGDDELHIMDIPYYNVSEWNGDKAIEFLYYPASQEEAQELQQDNIGSKRIFMEKILNDFRKK